MQYAYVKGVVHLKILILLFTLSYSLSCHEVFYINTSLNIFNCWSSTKQSYSHNKSNATSNLMTRDELTFDILLRKKLSCKLMFLM